MTKEQYIQALDKVALHQSILIGIIDEGYWVKYLSQSLQQFLNKNENVLPKVNEFWDLKSSKHFSGAFHESFLKALKGEYINIEMSIPEHDFNWKLYEVSFSLLSAVHGETKKVLCQLTNITEIVQKNEMLQVQNELLKEIIYVSSHETRLPVANIIGLSDILSQSEITDEEIKSYIDALALESNKLDQLVRRVVDLIGLYNTNSEDNIEG